MIISPKSRCTCEHGLPEFGNAVRPREIHCQFLLKGSDSIRVPQEKVCLALYKFTNRWPSAELSLVEDEHANRSRVIVKQDKYYTKKY